MELSQDELNERVAIIKRFKALLEQQRSKFQEYLHVLELQEKKIELEDTESILMHSELETQIVRGIGELQKVIRPMNDLYKKSGAATYNPQDIVPIEALQKDLKSLQSKVLAQNEKNRTLLKTQMVQMRSQIDSFKNPYRNLNSIYAKKSNTGSRISVEY